MWLRAGFLLLIALGLFFWASNAKAEAIYEANASGVKVTIYSEPCALKDQITNLSGRATWEENGKVNEGCVAFRPDIGLLLFWFDDKTVTVIPAGAFKRVIGV